MTVVGFVGMTHLGIVSSAAVAGRGYQTLCYDPDVQLIEALARGDLPILEPGLSDLMRAHGDRQRFTVSLADLGGFDVVYIAPDIPTDDEGCSDTAAILGLIEAVVPSMKPSAALVVLSQVEPGFTRALSAPPPERRYYQVETLVFGRAVERATQPERYIVGCADPAAPLNADLQAILAAFG